MSEDRPSHWHKTRECAVFPEGEDPDEIEPLASDYWEKADISNALASIRECRNRLIAATDYIEYSRRMNAQQRAEGLAYRDALFDMPEAEDPLNPVWPTKPSWLVIPD